MQAVIFLRKVANLFSGILSIKFTQNSPLFTKEGEIEEHLRVFK